MNIDENAQIRRFESLIDSNADLRDYIYYACIDDDTLVVFIGGDREAPFVKLTLSSHWKGDIEVYRTGDLMVGSRSRNEDILTSRTSKPLSGQQDTGGSANFG